MPNLWDKGGDLDRLTQEYCAGEDWRLDQQLLPFDIRASIAHAHGLAAAKLITKSELSRLTKELASLEKRWHAGTFTTTAKDEDGHTAIEEALTAKLGDLGKKIHTARSRNDQVGAALRLFAKDRLHAARGAAIELARALLDLAKRHEFVPMPGYTHTRKAMLSSAGTWAAAHAEAIADDVALLEAAHAFADRSPLGSAAGYGVPLPLRRDVVAKAAGFSAVHENVIGAQNARGRIEAISLTALSYLMLSVNRLCTDIVWFSAEEFGFLKLPDRFTTGSSIMPQKKNPDVFELARGAAALVSGCEHQVRSTLLSLPSGYNRDAQLTKEPFLRGVAHGIATLRVMAHVVPHLGFDEKRCRAACTPELFATDEALRRVEAGTPWRDAYRQVAAETGTWAIPDLDAALKKRSHIGGAGNLGLSKLGARLNKMAAKWR